MTHSTPHQSQPAPHGDPRRVTSYDVALLAGVSQSAVSRSFKAGASVSKATHERVMKAARALDYIPNAAARSLITRRTNMVAVIVSEFVTLYYPELLSELSRLLAQRGMRILLFSLPRSAAVDPTLAEVWRHQVDGAVVAARLSPAQVAEFGRRGVPVVLFNRNLRDQSVNAVVCDQLDAARTMVARLAAAGHKQFALIDGPPDSTAAQDRKHGVAGRLAELGLAAPLVVSGNFDYASGARGLREIVQRLGRAPDAVICGNDLMAIGCLDTARHELGIDVPTGMSVTGFDGIAASSWLSYNLTTLRQPVQSMALASVELLAGLIGSGGERPQRRVFSAAFVEGATARLGPAA